MNANEDIINLKRIGLIRPVCRPMTNGNRSVLKLHTGTVAYVGRPYYKKLHLVINVTNPLCLTDLTSVS